MRLIRVSLLKWVIEEQGQTLVMTVFCMAVLLGALGLAVDVGVLLHTRRQMQAAADAAAMAGATELFYNGNNLTSIKAKATAAAQDNLSNAGKTINVAVTPSPTLNPGAVSCPSCVQVAVSTPNPTIFMSTVNQWVFKATDFNTINVSAMATAGAPGVSNTCMYVMDPLASSALWIHGAGSINAPDCGIYVNSKDPGALCVTGSAGKSNFSEIDVHGGQGNANCGGDPGGPVKEGSGVQSLPSKWSGVPDDPRTNCGSVTAATTLSGDQRGQAPGYGNYKCYANGTCASTTRKGVTTISCTPVTLDSATLGPGIYVFETGVKIKGATTIGSNSPNGGATVIVTGNSPGSMDGGVYDSGTATTFYDYAPTSGTYNGIAIYQPAGDKQTIGLQFGSGSSIFDGAVLAKSAAVDLHDQGGAVNATVLVVGQAYVNGKVNLTNYNTYNPTTTPFKHITLVQ
jgi:Flp pilus assembly protein TadG